MLHFRSLRFRVAATFILGTLVVSGVVAGTSYFLIQQRLISDRVQASLNQTEKYLRIFKDEILLAGGEGVTTDSLATLVDRPVDAVIICCNPPDVAESSRQLSVRDIPDELRQVVRTGKVAYAMDYPGRRIIFGARIPSAGAPGEVYLAYSTRKSTRTLALLRKIFPAVIGVAALLAGIVGVRLAGATIRPLRLAAEAARRVADGNLETRLHVSGEDELGRLATAFNQMTEALEERIARERRFVADVSHELRTPLTTLKSSVDFLRERLDDLPAKFHGPLTLAAEEVRSLQRLVDDLLELSRVEAGGVVAESEEVDLVNFAHELTRRRAPGANVHVSGPDELIVSTDKMRLERIVGNLLENAVFHGGRDHVSIELHQNNGRACISVVDSGPGIDPEKLPRIFERFWRGDASRQRDGRIGAGLGLSIARENAMVIGADIHVASEPGVGTRFDVVIPIEDVRPT